MPLDYTYTYHEMKIILEGDFTITLLDSSTTSLDSTTSLSEQNEEGKGDAQTEGKEAKTVKAGPGDVFYFEKGSRIRFETVGGGLAFYVGQVGFPASSPVFVFLFLLPYFPPPSPPHSPAATAPHPPTPVHCLAFRDPCPLLHPVHGRNHKQLTLDSTARREPRTPPDHIPTFHKTRAGIDGGGYVGCGVSARVRDGRGMRHAAGRFFSHRRPRTAPLGVV